MSDHSIPENFLFSSCDVDSFLKKCPDAREITVVGDRITSLTAILDFERLENLTVQGLYHVGSRRDSLDDFSALPKFPFLKKLHVHDCRHFDDAALKYVSQMPVIESISISSFMHTIVDVTPLGNLSTLRLLDLSEYSGGSTDSSNNFLMSRKRHRRAYLAERNAQLETLAARIPECEIRLPPEFER